MPKCGCGCGTDIPEKDDRGRRRSFVKNHHNKGKSNHWLIKHEKSRTSSHSFARTRVSQRDRCELEHIGHCKGNLQVAHLDQDPWIVRHGTAPPHADFVASNRSIDATMVDSGSHPCPTITAAGGNPGLASVCHPLEKRKFSIAELKRICGFPDDFDLRGSYQQQWERCGRAVPPQMMHEIAKTVRDKILIPLRDNGKI